MKENDLIVKAAGQTVTTVDEINEIKDPMKVGDTLVLTLYRNGEVEEVPVILEERLE
ncbi:MAG: PDZ domain-containing protein [Oscillospiraceae bacterium]|nr:PDZ domain-containing protein [Oscillospiraceae bacterium]